MSFMVLPRNLHESAVALEELGDVMGLALSYTEAHVKVTADHGSVGTFFLDVKNRTNELQAQLLHDYSRSGPITDYYHSAAEALHQVADDYSAIDDQQAEIYDEQLAICAEDDLVVPDYDFDLPPYSGISVDEIGAMLVPPSGWMEAEQGWQQFQNGVDLLCSLEWLTYMLIPPVGDPLRSTLADLRDEFNGPWMQVGHAAAALDTLANVNHELNVRVALAAQNLAWQGTAATAAKNNLADFREVLAGHVDDLHSLAAFLNMRAWAMVKVMDAATSLLEWILDLCTSLNPLDILDALSRGRVPPILGKILGIIPLVSLCIDVLAALVGGIGLTFHALFDRDTTLPAIDPPSTDIGAPA